MPVRLGALILGFAAMALCACNSSSQAVSEKNKEKTAAMLLDDPAWCDRIADLNARCADAFAKQGAKRLRQNLQQRLNEMEPEQRAKSMKLMEQRIVQRAGAAGDVMRSDDFRNGCRKEWNNEAKMPKRQKQQLIKCVEAADCDVFADCFFDTAFNIQ